MVVGFMSLSEEHAPSVKSRISAPPGCRFWWGFPRPRRRFADVGQAALDARTIAWHLPVVSPGRPRDRGHLER
jgi:hypothetical protein